MLGPAEKARAQVLPTEARRRHFALGRLAARRAIARLVLLDTQAEVLSGTFGEPVVDGAPGCGIRVSLSHDDGLAAACAWLAGREGHAAGIDVERLRRSRVGESHYAFSRRERRVVRSAGRPSLAGLAAWAAKEAAWKALSLGPDSGPESVELRRLDLGARRAEVVAHPRLGRGQRSVMVRLRPVAGPDGRYVLALAETREG